MSLERARNTRFEAPIDASLKNLIDFIGAGKVSSKQLMESSAWYSQAYEKNPTNDPKRDLVFKSLLLEVLSVVCHDVKNGPNSKYSVFSEAVFRELASYLD